MQIDQFDLTPIIEAVITIVALLITSYIIPYIKSKSSAQKQAEINQWVKIAVAAAEQIYRNSGHGAEKKEYVIAWLAARNIKYDSSKIDAMIEAAVYDLKQNGLLFPAANELVSQVDSTDLM